MQRALLINQDARVKRFISGLQGYAVNPAGPSCAIGVTVDGQLVCGVIYSDFHDRCIAMHASSTTPAWCTRFILGKLLAYAFVTNDCVRMSTINAASNKRAHQVLKRIGFKLEGVHPLGWNGREAAYSFGLLRDDAAKWIGAEEMEYGQQIAPNTRCA